MTNNSITEIKNTLEGINSRLEKAEDLEDKVRGSIQAEQQKE